MCIDIDMKAIQITFDEKLLKELDASEEVRRDGRSAVLRRAAAEYLRRKHRHTIAERYAAAYGGEPRPGEEFRGWEDEGRWPSD
jgi:predicted transcriptional regulator